MSEFLMPSLGADMESAILMEWMVKEGEEVKKGQVIAEVETSKGVIEIEVFEDGIVEKLLVETETDCKVGSPLALIRSANDEEIKVKVEEVTPIISEPSEENIKDEEVSKSDEEVSQISKDEEVSIVEEKIEETQRIKASPAARNKAQEIGIDLFTLASKMDGAVHLSDVEAISSKKKKVEKKRNKDSNDGMRKAIAAAMSRSNAEIPHYYLSTSINMTPALKWLEELNKTHSIKDRILPAALLIQACVKALKEVPELNGFYKDGSLVVKEEINPGIAIALRKGGLITPAIINAGEMTLDKSMKSLDDLITRTRKGKLKGSEMTEQTITITNLGDLGVERVYGVIYPPQVAIIGIGRIVDAPWAEGDTLSVRKVMQATIAGDHRATDGRTGALFLDKLNNFLQKPEELL